MTFGPPSSQYARPCALSWSPGCRLSLSSVVSLRLAPSAAGLVEERATARAVGLRTTDWRMEWRDTQLILSCHAAPIACAHSQPRRLPSNSLSPALPFRPPHRAADDGRHSVQLAPGPDERTQADQADQPHTQGQTHNETADRGREHATTVAGGGEFPLLTPFTLRLSRMSSSPSPRTSVAA